VRPLRLPAAVIAALLALGGCASAPPPERDRGAERIIQRQKLVWYIGEEYPFIWDPQVVAEVNRLGTTLSRAVGVSDNAFHFYVIDQPMVNAFATPLGDIFIFSGMITRMRSSSELAGVLAHEIGHVQADHFTQMQRRATLGSIPGLVAAILSKGDPRVIAGTIAAAQSYQLHWSREMELQSDRLALQYLRKTKYDPEGMLGALVAIQQGERLLPSEAPEHLLTHPITTLRIATMEGALIREPGKGYQPERDPAWERLQAVLRALTEKPYVVRQMYRRRLREDSADAHSLMGVVLAKQENYPEAEKHFRQALEKDPRNPLYLLDLGSALFHQGRFEEARKVLQESLSLARRGNSSEAWYYLGEMYKMGGDRDAAYEAYEKSVNSWPPLSEAHYQFALYLAEEERLGEADFYFAKAAQLRGDYASALRNFRRAEARLGSDPGWGSRISSELWRMQ